MAACSMSPARRGGYAQPFVSRYESGRGRLMWLGTGVASGIGSLMGTERERSKGNGPDREIAGVRTFALASLLGAFAGTLESVAALATFGALIA